MSLLAEALGYARLAEPVRFRAAWEQDASLRLRDGDTTVLAEYDQHARILGGESEQMMDAAAAAYIALTTSGTDTLLMAADHALRCELSRRIRDDLIALGAVHDGPAVTIADGTRASPGDLIICTRNDHGVEAGEPGRALANGDLLRIDAVTRDGLLVRCALATAPNPATRPGGCGAPCAAPNWPTWTRPASWPRPSPNETWPDRATSPPLGAAVGRRRAPPGPRRRPRSRPGRGPRRRGRRSCRKLRRPSGRRPAPGPGGQLPGHGGGLPGPRARVRRGHGRPGRLGSGHPRPAPPSRGRRRRTTPPASAPAVHPAPFGRTTGRHRRPARRAHPDRRAGPSRFRPWIRDLDAGHRRSTVRLADRQSLTIPAEDPDYGDLGQAFPAWTGSSRDAILQPPKPQIRPSARVLERAADREADIEAGE